jgi:two-component system chemotaxis sensor kinase CheA
MIAKGLDPLFAFTMLRGMGQLDLAADMAALPNIAGMQAAGAYLAWTGCLETTSPREDLDAVLSPLAEDCEIAIVDLTPAVDLPPMPEEAFVPEVAPAPAAASALVPAAAPAPVAAVPAVEEAAKAPAKDGAKDGQKAAKPGAATTIRVELEKIDRVVNMVGELVIAQAMLGQVIEDLPEEIGGRVANILSDLVRHTRGLKDSVMAIRAQPVSSVFQRMPRLVRELSIKTGKRVEVEMFGENTEVDKTIIERLSDPLTHIIRNSIDHGIESPADRMVRGKPEHGTIRLSADQRGGRIVIEISDDGAGINCERVLKKARDKGLVDPNANLTDEEICNLIFLPGFSTAEAVSDISGRGVGMDVVRRNIQDLGGRTSIRSEAGRGMTIQLALPLTLAVMDGMVVEVDRQTYVLPIPNIVECLRPNREEIHHLLGTAGTLQLRGDIVPLVHLGELLGVSTNARDRTAGIVIITEASDGTRLGLIADELCGHQQVVIKSIEENCGAVEGIAGATILGDGHVAFILDVEALSELTTEPRYAGGANPGSVGIAA